MNVDLPDLDANARESVLRLLGESVFDCLFLSYEITSRVKNYTMIFSKTSEGRCFEYAQLVKNIGEAYQKGGKLSHITQSFCLICRSSLLDLTCCFYRVWLRSGGLTGGRRPAGGRVQVP